MIREVLGSENMTTCEIPAQQVEELTLLMSIAMSYLAASRTMEVQYALYEVASSQRCVELRSVEIFLKSYGRICKDTDQLVIIANN